MLLFTDTYRAICIVCVVSFYGESELQGRGKIIWVRGDGRGCGRVMQDQLKVMMMRPWYGRACVSPSDCMNHITTTLAPNIFGLKWLTITIPATQLPIVNSKVVM